MKKHNLFFAGFFGMVSLFLQGQSDPDYYMEYESYYDTTAQKAAYPVNYAPYGQVYTPKGTIRVLIIFARLTNDADQACGTWPAESEVPEFVNPDDGTCPDLIFNDMSEFSLYAGTTNRSISRFYNDFSMGQFFYMGDILCDADGHPHCIAIDPTAANPDFNNAAGGWPDLNLRVMTKMKQEFPDFDWSPYDLHENWPKFQQDASITGPDSFPDYVIIAYRYQPTWATQPVAGMNGWPGSSGGRSRLEGLKSLDYNGYNFDDAGFTNCTGGWPVQAYVSHISHENAHELYSSPHYMSTNWCVGNRWQFPASGWGVMKTAGGREANYSANAWERWLLGWHELTTSSSNVNSDIQSPSDLVNNGIYTLRDFITTGDMVRVKIPNTDDNYLWIENHQKISAFDHKTWAGLSLSIDGEQIPEIESGLYMYVENILGDRSEITTGMVSTMDKVNGIKIVSAQGNYDYWHSPTAPEETSDYYYNNTIFTFRRETENPISGINPYYKVPDDYPNDPQIPGSNGVIAYSNNFNGSTQEAYLIIRETDNVHTCMTYANIGGVNYEARNLLNRRSDAFQVNDEVSLSGIVPALNYPLYDKANNRIGNYILNGLYVKVLSYSWGSMQIQIKLDDYTVRNNKRWCGFIELRDNTGNTNPDLILATGAQIDIDKNGNANRHTKHPAFNDFINPTIFYQMSNSYFLMDNSTQVIVKNNSAYVSEVDGLLEITNGAVFRVKTGSTLIKERFRSGCFRNRQSRSRNRRLPLYRKWRQCYITEYNQPDTRTGRCYPGSKYQCFNRQLRLPV